jgi:hypothetical protein
MKAVTVTAVPARRPRVSTLWRVAPHVRPYFGRGSHWTTSEDSARGLQRWLEETSPVRRVIYRAEVQLTDVFEAPPEILLGLSEVARCVALAWPQGYQWLTFYEAGEWDSRLAKQYVYLGCDPITVADRHRVSSFRRSLSPARLAPSLAPSLVPALHRAARESPSRE